MFDDYVCVGIMLVVDVEVLCYGVEICVNIFVVGGIGVGKIMLVNVFLVEVVKMSDCIVLIEDMCEL